MSRHAAPPAYVSCGRIRLQRPLQAIHRLLALVLLLSLTPCAHSMEGRPVTGPSPGLLEVRHTPLSREDIPKELIERLQQLDLRYVRFYRTDLTNNTNRPIRVIWFDAFFKSDGPWIASNVRGRVLRTKDFLGWYTGDDMSADGWLRAGGTASCHVNWHFTETPDELLTKWSYVAIDACGNDYFGEAVVLNTKPADTEMMLRVNPAVGSGRPDPQGWAGNSMVGEPGPLPHRLRSEPSVGQIHVVPLLITSPPRDQLDLAQPPHAHLAVPRWGR